MSAAESSQTWENQSHELPTKPASCRVLQQGFVTASFRGASSCLHRMRDMPSKSAKINRSLASETPPLQHRLTELAAMPSSRRAFGSSKAPRHPPTLSLSLSLRTPGREAHPQFFYSLSLSLSLSLYRGRRGGANPNPSARGRAPAGLGGVFENPPRDCGPRRLGCTQAPRKLPQQLSLSLSLSLSLLQACCDAAASCGAWAWNRCRDRDRWSSCLRLHCKRKGDLEVSESELRAHNSNSRQGVGRLV